MGKKVKRYVIKVLDSVKDLYGFVVALNDYFKSTPWGDYFKFNTDGKCFYDETEEYTYEFDLDYGTRVGEQIAEVAKEYFGSDFDYIEPESLGRFCVVLNTSSSFSDSKNEFEADKYKGKEWGVFAKRSRAWVAFGTEKAMKEKAKELNKIAIPTSKEEIERNLLVVDSETKKLSIYFLENADYARGSLQDIDEEEWLQGFHHHIWEDAKRYFWDTKLVNKALDYFSRLEGTVEDCLEKTSEYVEFLETKRAFKDGVRLNYEDDIIVAKYKGKVQYKGIFDYWQGKDDFEDMKWNKEKKLYEDKSGLMTVEVISVIDDSTKHIQSKDGAINYKHSKNDMPSYGVDLRELEENDEDYNDIYFHDLLEQTQDLIETANENIQEKGYELVEDYYGDEIKLVIDPGYYEGFTLNIEANEDLPKELLEYAFGLMKEIADEVGLVKMKFGGWTGPVYLEDSSNSEVKYILEYIGEDSFDRPVYRDKKTKRLFCDTNLMPPYSEKADICTKSGGFDGEPDYPVDKKYYEFSKNKNVEDKSFKDMNAEEIINLINEAGEKGRSWEWLEGKLPREFLYLYNKKGRVFPGQHDYRGTRELIHLTKPKNLGEDLDFSWLPEYESLKKELDPLYEKYNADTASTFRKAIKDLTLKEDSISKRALIESDRTKFETIKNAIENLIKNSGITSFGDYYYTDFSDRDFVFKKNEYLKALKGSYDNVRYKERQKKGLITSPEKNYITSKSDKVEPLTLEAENYIRRILKKEDTDNIKSKRETRRNLESHPRGDIEGTSSKDILNSWKKDRRKLKDLLSVLKTLEMRGTIRGISYSGPKEELEYRKDGPYNYRGDWVGPGGGYDLTNKRIKPSAVVNGIEREVQKPLSEAISRAFIAKSVAELKSALVEALQAVELLPDDSIKIKKAKQDIIDFINSHRESILLRQRSRTRKLPDSKSQEDNYKGEYLYLFPMDGMSKKDLEVAKDYDLEFLGKNFFQGEKNYVISGSRKNLKKYAKDYLDYELHPDYLYHEDEFAGKIV